jgi:superfamily II DNA or RNA helicase
MSFSKFINSCKDFKDFISKTSKLKNKGNWKKQKLAKDTAFEFLSKLLIEKHPLFKKLNVQNVWHESEIPARDKKIINYPIGIGDEGIDLLIKTKDNKYHAVQSKFRTDQNETLVIGKRSDLGTTFNLVNNICKNIENIYVFATINSAPKKIKLVPKNCIFILNSFFRELDKTEKGFKWSSLKKKFIYKDNREDLKEADEFQIEAVKKLKKYFKKKHRGCLFLPCGTGKTLISYWFAQEMKYKKILILVPNLTLVSQILNNWVTQNFAKNIDNNKWLVVCSDKDVRINEDPLVINTKDLPFDTTTNEKKIKSFLKDNDKQNFLIISTYNSSHKISSISKKMNYTFDLCIFDEAHKTVGTKDKLFSNALYEKNIRIKKRLFMTATKRVIHGHEKIVDMRNEKIYGQIAHEISFKEAIEGNNPRLCNYKFKALGISKDKILELWKSNPQVRSKNLDSTTMKYLSGLILLFNIWNQNKLRKGITFHNTIGGSENFKKIAEQYQKYLNPNNDVQFFNISSKRSLTGDKQSIISDFANDKKSIITNARCLVEGVDVPAVDIILFADKKKSRVDIVQAIGRCLRKSPGKKFGYIVVPFIFDKNQSKEKLLQSDYKDVIKTIRILSLYDKTFSEDIKFQAKSGEYFNGKVEIDIPYDDAIINIEEIKKAIRIENFKSTGPLNWLSYDEAKEYVRSKNVKTAQEYFKRHKNGEFDFDLPFSINTIYADEGFKSWGDFLGTGSISHSIRKELYWPFKKAREYIRSLNLSNQGEWVKYCSSSEKLLEIPSHPHIIYKKEWLNTGDWLGTGTIAAQNMEFDFEKSKKWNQDLINKFNIKSIRGKKRSLRNQLNEIIKKNKIIRPYNVTSNPGAHFKNHRNYKGEGTFFGWSSAITKLNPAMEFSKAREFAHALNLSGKDKWELYVRNKIPNKPILPDNMPANPNSIQAYRKFWNGWGDWLGTGNKPGAQPKNKNYLKKI